MAETGWRDSLAGSTGKPVVKSPPHPPPRSATVCGWELGQGRQQLGSKSFPRRVRPLCAARGLPEKQPPCCGTMKKVTSCKGPCVASD